MTTAENEAIIRGWFQAFNDRDWPAEAAVHAADFVAHVPGAPPLDNEAWKAFIAAFVAGFPDFRLTIEDVIAAGDRVAVRWVFQGTHQGEFHGVPPAGRPVSVAAMEVNRMADGKVAEHWVLLDLLGLMQQVGAIPAPGAGGQAP
ncbi:MAG TPA: ester cyclase [Chloroflexota bacterium]|nr:ester cyclase [Chloroflexota bacterium]